MRGSFTQRIAQVASSKLLAGGGLLLIGMTIVNAGNYVFNLILGRWLGPTAFADLSLIVTLFLVITFVTAALQTTAAKYAATYTVDHDWGRTDALRAWLNRRAWQVGLALMAAFALGSPLWSWFFQTKDL
ncbi:MAG: hypothetical protein SH847_19160 [Roseiflexaceae bacterium]|nr:hypothetical protein [Roseiflexaceae bacterium]